MSDLEHLGGRLREQLHALVEDVNPSAELSASVDAIPSARRAGLRSMFARARRRPVAFAASIPLAAAAAAAVFIFGASSPTSSIAGAVVVLPNGSVRVTLSQLSNVEAANAVLRRHHIRNMVVVPMTASCPNRNVTYTLGVGPSNPDVVTLTPTTLAPGWTVVLAAKRIAPRAVLSGFGRVRDHVPTCVSSHGRGPGMGDLKPGTGN